MEEEGREGANVWKEKRPENETEKREGLTSTNQGSSETEDGEQRSGGGVSHVTIIPRFFAQLHVSARDVIRQFWRHRRLLLLAQSNVPERRLRIGADSD